MTHNPQLGDILISLTNGERGDRTRAISLRIEDGATYRTLVEVDMNGAQFTDLVTSGNVKVDEYLIEVTTYPGSTFPVELTVSNPADRIVVEVNLGAEDFAAILGNKVTRLSNARIFPQNVEG